MGLLFSPSLFIQRMKNNTMMERFFTELHIIFTAAHDETGSQSILFNKTITAFS